MILSIGEILVDIFKEGENEKVFPGGAPFNVACNVASFNKDAISFFGSVGNDKYGRFLAKHSYKKIERCYLDILKDRKTSKAIVTLDNGERSFKFDRNLGADYILNINKLKEINLEQYSIIHLGSLMLSFEEGRKFFFDAIKYIRQFPHILISFDVNYRDDIFPNEEVAKEIFVKALKSCDIIKFTEEELKLLTDKENVLDGLKRLLNDKQIAVVTLGKEGSNYYFNNKFYHVPTYPVVSVDTTGAGDAFYSYFLYSLDKGMKIDDALEICNTLKRANVVGGFATLKKGAIDVVPTLEEIEKYLSDK